MHRNLKFRGLALCFILLPVSEQAIAQVYCAGGDGQIRCVGNECYCPGGGAGYRAPAYQPPAPRQPTAEELRQEQITRDFNNLAAEARRPHTPEERMALVGRALSLREDSNLRKWLNGAQAVANGNEAFASKDYARALAYYKQAAAHQYLSSELSRAIADLEKYFDNERKTAVAQRASQVAAQKLIDSVRNSQETVETVPGLNFTKPSPTPPVKNGQAANIGSSIMGTKPSTPTGDDLGPAVSSTPPAKNKTASAQADAVKKDPNCFDGRSCGAGTSLVFPERLQSAAVYGLAAQIAKDPILAGDEAFQKGFAWYRHIDGQLIDKEKELAEVQQEIDSGTGDLTFLEQERTVFETDAKLIKANQVNAKKAMDERAKQLSKTIDWSEEAPASKEPLSQEKAQ
jgi:hypothetical protein